MLQSLINKNRATPSKNRTKLDNIPEETALSIIKFVQSWAEQRGNLEERETQRRARDHTLRAVALSCRKLYGIWHQSLIENVTVTNLSIATFYQSLVKNPEYGTMVRSINFIDDGGKVIMATPELISMSNIPLTKGNLIVVNQVIEDAFKNIFQGLGEKLTRVHTIVVVDASLLPPLQIKIQGKSVPNPLLTSSLKRLTIPPWIEDHLCLKAKNVAWILLNCSQLEEASLGCVVSVTDYHYLKEYQSHIASLSNVKKLALQVRFVFIKSNRDTFWDLDTGKEWKGGSKKTEAIIHLLSVVKSLAALEVFMAERNDRPGFRMLGNRTFLYATFLPTLQSSLESLTQLRLFHVVGDRDRNISSPNFECLKNLKIFTLEYATLAHLVELTKEIILPSSLEVLVLPFYNLALPPTNEKVLEDVQLKQVLESRALPNLKQVVVPSRLIDCNRGTDYPLELQRIWRERRRDLEQVEVFTSGRMTLYESEPGEFFGDRFMSTLPWLTP